MLPSPSSEPSSGRIIRTLKEGYWDRTEVVEQADGSRRVRKRNKGAHAKGPWGVESLRREIRYLTTLPPGAAETLPPVLACWDCTVNGASDIGYETPFYFRHTDAGELARRGTLSQGEINAFQRDLAEAVLARIHAPMTPAEPLSRHLTDTIEHALAGLVADPALARVIGAPMIALNGQRSVGTREALRRIVEETDALKALDAVPSVRLHGDCFLENILWRSAAEPADERRLILLDPVSVAGISCGPPFFDLVKYESYATGELLALRSERVELAGMNSPDHVYHWRIRTEDSALAPFQTLNWHRDFRRAFEARYGEPDYRLCRLIDGYFSLAMALNTTGLQQQARLLKGTAELNAVLRSS